MPEHAAYRKVESKLPNQPGVYRFYAKDDTLLYVGKAKNLKKRVASYFSKNKHYSSRISLMVRKTARVEFTIVDSEQDSLILENTLIKENQPRYNIMLRDDKSYPYICIKNERFPRVFLTRKLIKDGSEYLGPYTSVNRAKSILELLKNLFPLRTCNYSLTEENIMKGKFKICLEHHLGNCLGPCEDLQTEENYNESIKQIRHILKGKSFEVLQYLKTLMKEHAEVYEYEEAEKIKYKIEAMENYKAKSTIVNTKIDKVEAYAIEMGEKKAYVNYFRISNGAIIQTKMIELTRKLDEEKEELLAYAVESIRLERLSDAKEIYVPFPIILTDESVKITVPKIGDKLKLVELAYKNARFHRNQQMIRNAEKKPNQRALEVLVQLKEDFRLTEIPRHIECFDNSNFQGSSPVASMVVFKEAKPSKKDYRHFHIKTVEGPDDFASMEEVVKRRYTRLLETDSPLPQLIVIDGGKGQLNAAIKSLKVLGIESKVAIAGIAKRLEEIYLPNDPLPLYINKKSQSLKLIQQLRNEAHRFAISFHRKTRDNKVLRSEFHDIKGLGPKSIERLYTHFKSNKSIKEASITELEAIIDKRKAKILFEYFNKSSN